MKPTDPAPDIYFKMLPRRKHTFGGLIAVVVIMLALLWWKHHTWLSDPNAFMLGTDADAFKNYLTASWHVRYDTTFLHYGGMNYPYGEHVLFTDNQPLFSAALQWWNWHISPISNWTVGLVNLFLIFSMMAGAGATYLLLRKLHLPVWYAGIAAIGIIFLSPQNHRFDQHFALSHTWVLPALLFLLARYEERSSRRYQSLLIGLLVWFAAQLHFYYFGLAAVFLGFYTLFQVIIDPTWRNIRFRFSHLVVMVLLPFFYLNFWVRLTNYAPDRPATPFGFLNYRANLPGLIFPGNGTFFNNIGDRFFSLPELDFEARLYLGLVAVGFTLWVFVRRFRMFPSAWNHMAYHRVHRNYIIGLFFAAFAMLVFSLGFPFTLPGMKNYLEILGPLKQFRGLARFAWAFFYVANVLAFYVAWNKSLHFQGFRGGNYKNFRWVIALVPLWVLVMEAFSFQAGKKVVANPNLLLPEYGAPDNGHWLNRIDLRPFQAILPLPYYHIGSENIWLPADSSLFRKTQLAAYYSGTPDMGVFLSRTPMNQTLRSLQLVFEPGVFPEIVGDLSDKRPIALFIQSDQWDTVRKRYFHLLEKAQPVYQDSVVKILAFYPDSLHAVVRERARAAQVLYQQTPLKKSARWMSETVGEPLAFFSYDTLKETQRQFFGGGAYTANIRDTSWILKDTLPKGRYRLSGWVYARSDMGLLQIAHAVETRPNSGKEVWHTAGTLQQYAVEIIDGWVMFDMPFSVTEDGSIIRIYFHNSEISQNFFLDEVIVRSENSIIFRKTPEWMIVNNFWRRLE